MNHWLLHSLVTEPSYEDRPLRAKPLISSTVFAVLVFIVTEIMLFASLISAYMIIRSGLEEWPPWGQPRLPVWTTAFNSVVLIGSAFLLRQASIFLKTDRTQAFRFSGYGLGAGVFFLLFQGYEWAELLSYGLTLSSSNYGGMFYLIIGMHGLHVLGAVIALTFTWFRLAPEARKPITDEGFQGMLVFWYFVVGIWPILYALVYLA